MSQKTNKTKKKDGNYVFIAFTALFAATLTAAKFSLAAIPNIEIVTLLIVTYSLCFPRGMAITATAVFCIIETFIWGINTWVLSYIVYWPMLSLVTSFFANRKHKILIGAIVGIVFTALFGVWTTLVDVVLAGGLKSPLFLKIFLAKYVAGITFYVVHVISNTIVLGLVLRLIVPKLDNLRQNIL